jgi:glycosyltransferase involved in cell wall biosynthesis
MPNNKKPLSVLYTGAFRFPDKDAAAFRVYSIARMFQSEGHSVSFAGWESGPEQYEYNGHACHPQSEFRERDTNPLVRFFGFLFRGWRTLKWLRKNNRFDLVIAYNPPALFALALIVLGELRGFAVALDSTEWYDGGHLPGGRYGPAAAENWIRMRVSYPLFRNVIAISTFLEGKFSKSNVVRIPPLWQSQVEPVPEPDSSTVIKVLYAGDAGKKDKLIPFIEAISTVEQLVSRRIELHIAGLNESALDTVLDGVGVVPRDRTSIVCHGRVPRSEVIDLYRACHFSVLFREDARYAWAGFPTKAMESWSSGRPIITNAIGDLAQIARNLENAIVVTEPLSPEILADALSTIFDKNAYGSMVEGSLRTAKTCFAPEAYRGALLEFIRKM